MAGLWGGSGGVKASKGNGDTWDPFGTTGAKDQSRLPSELGGSTSKTSGSTTTVSKSTSSDKPSTAAAKAANPFDDAFSAITGTPQTLTAADRSRVTQNMTNQTMEERQAALDKMNGKTTGTMASKPVTTSRVTEEMPALPPVPAYVEEPIAPSRQVSAAQEVAAPASARMSVSGGLAPAQSLSMTGSAPQEQAKAAAPTTDVIGNGFASLTGATRSPESYETKGDVTRSTQSAWDSQGNPNPSGGRAQSQATSTREAALNGSLPSTIDAAPPSQSAFQANGQPDWTGAKGNGLASGLSVREAALNGSLPGGFDAMAPSTNSTEKTGGKSASGGRSSASGRSADVSSAKERGAVASTTTASPSSNSSSRSEASPSYGDRVTTTDGRTGSYAAPGLAITDNSGGFTPTSGGGQQGGGGCYITTAAMLGHEADDGPTLTALRRFRDMIMAPRDDWRDDIATYYRTAPGIVARIDASRAPEKIYTIIRRHVLAPCVRFIEAGEYDRAHRLYRRMVDFLGRIDLR